MIAFCSLPFDLLSFLFECVFDLIVFFDSPTKKLSDGGDGGRSGDRYILNFDFFDLLCFGLL